ncbi:MAG: prepilin-type N-terminal cleavage/methylation domain-containing protein [Patescibacteria group bacterium]
MSIFFQRFNGSRRSARAFTLIELLVVLSIVIVITAVLLVRQAQFNSSTLLRSLSYSIALSVRQAQVYGTTVFGSAIAQGSCTGGTYNFGSCFAPAYGIYVSSGDTAHYYIFGDLNNNGRYDAGEAIQTFTLGSGYTISQFCAGRITGSTQDCWISTGGGVLSSLSTVFKRPNPDACFSTDTNPTVCSTGVNPLYASSSIQVVAGSGDTRTVVVTQTGQIAVCPVNRSC